jgi:hypothetical protein
MNPRMNLSPQMAAMIPTLSTRMMFRGKSNWVHIAKPAASTKPKMNLNAMVTATPNYIPHEPFTSQLTTSIPMRKKIQPLLVVVSYLK